MKENSVFCNKIKKTKQAGTLLILLVFLLRGFSFQFYKLISDKILVDLQFFHKMLLHSSLQVVLVDMQLEKCLGREIRSKAEQSYPPV